MRNWGGRAVAACLLAGSGMARAESHSLPPGGEAQAVEGEPRGKAAAEEWAWKRVQ